MSRAGLLLVVVAVSAAAALPAAAGATAITEFPVKVHAGSDPSGITAGADGNLWFTDGGTTRAIGRITPAGLITEFTFPAMSTGGKPIDITLGPDGNVWFTETGSSNNAIGRITPAGAITEFPILGSAPSNILAGPDGNLWFIDDGATHAIGRITPAGQISEFTMAQGLNFQAAPNAMTLGPDGNMWFTDPGAQFEALGRVTPAGVIKEFTVGDGTTPRVNLITAGADGNLWFSDDGTGSIGKVTPSGTVTEFTMGLQTGTQPDALTLAPDGNVWFNDQYSNQRAIGQVKPSAAITEFHQGLASGLQDDITVGADGNLWIEQSTPGGIARITTAGTITEFTTGLLPGAGADGDHIISGPDGNLWFNDRGARAIAKVSLQVPPTATTGAASAVTNTSATVSGSVTPLGAATTVTFRYGTTPAFGSTVSAGTLTAGATASTVTAGLTGLPPGTVIFYQVVADNGSGTVTGGVQKFKTTGSASQAHIVTGQIGNQLITLENPSLQSCTTASARLTAKLTSVPNGKRNVAKLRFASAAFFLDRGIRHKRKTTRRIHGHRTTVTLVVFGPNATARHVPATETLRVTGLKSGSHTLKVVVSFRELVAHHKTKTVTKTLTLKFRVC